MPSRLLFTVFGIWKYTSDCLVLLNLCQKVTDDQYWPLGYSSMQYRMVRTSSNLDLLISILSREKKRLGEKEKKVSAILCMDHVARKYIYNYFPLSLAT